MSQNQSRADRSDYRKSGRSGTSNQQRQFSGGSSKGGGGPSSGPSNRGNKKYNSNASVGQSSTLNSNVSSTDSSTAHSVQNGAHPTHRVSDAQFTTTSSHNPTDAPSQKVIRPPPKAAPSNVSSTAAPSTVSNSISDPKAPATPGKVAGETSKPYPLQFGSISPGFMNGMQIPARTSSAPPNLDEQKKDQMRFESSRTGSAMPAPSVPKQHLPKKDAGTLDQPLAGEAHPASKSRSDIQVSNAPPGTQAQKPSLHTIPSIPLQVPFQPPHTHVHFGAPNPQIQSQSMPGPIPMPLGNPAVQHPVFVPGLHHHHMQSQGMMHHGQSMNFSPPVGHQLNPQLGNMGMGIGSQFMNQPVAKFSGSRKTVKITHPDTREEVRLDSSPAQRLPPGVQSQSQPMSSFPTNMPINFYPGPYNAPSLFFPPANSVPLGTTQVPPTSQLPRLYGQVTVKPPVVSHTEKEPPLSSGSKPIVKGEPPKSSRLKGESSVFPHKEIEALSSSSVLQPIEASYASTATSHSASVSSSATDGDKIGVETPNSVEDKHEKQGNRDLITPDGMASLSSLPSQLPKAETLEAKYAIPETNLASETSEEQLSAAVSASFEPSGLVSDCATGNNIGNESENLGSEGINIRPSEPEIIERKKLGETVLAEDPEYKHSLETSLRTPKIESPEFAGNIEDSSNQEVTSTFGGLSEYTHEKPEEATLSIQNEKSSSSDVSLPDIMNTREKVVAKGSLRPEISDPVLIPSPVEDSSRPEIEDIKINGRDLVSPSPSIKDTMLDANVVKSVVPVRKKKKELYRKLEAVGTSSDLYMAYKGPEEKKETVSTAEGSNNSSNINKKQISADMPQENTVVCDEPVPVNVEPDDWEDAAEISTPELTSGNGYQDNAISSGLMKIRYSRDFLLKFADQFADLPNGFEVTTDIVNRPMVSSVNFSRESYPSPGRSMERQVSGSRSDRRGSVFADEDKWNKVPGPLITGRDMWNDGGYMGNNVGFQPGQGGNFGVLRNPRGQSPGQYGGGILSGPIQSPGPQAGMLRNNADSDRWQRATGFQKGLMPSPQTPMQAMHRADRKYEVGKVTDEEQARQRQLKSILNKLTPQNFEKLFQQVKDVNIDNVITLSGVISQIFDKALMEPTFCEMYADFCFHLAADLPDLSADNEKITFKRLLLNKCQEEFERGEREEEEANKAEEEGEVKQSAEEREEKRLQVRRRMLGNIRLIGELYKKKMLTERIMHECINKLLGQYQNPDEENIEALCKLMSTIGEMIDHPKAKDFMDAYYEIMAKLSNNMKLSSRVRFMLKDSIDLRKNKWQQRRKVEGPKKIEDVHRDAVQERQAQSRLGRVPSTGGSSVRRGPPMEFGPRSPSVFPSPNSQLGGYRGPPPQVRGYGSQDARVAERHSSVPLPQNDFNTLGPQGGLARGMSFRGQPSVLNIPSTDMPDARRMGPGQNGFSYSQKEDLMPRYMTDRFAAPPTYDHGNSVVGNTNRALDTSLPTSQPPRGGPTSYSHDVSLDKRFSEDYLRDKSVATIKEFYSARDEKEVALCIKDLNTPSFYPSMISIWVTDSFERKDMERDLLTKLLINLTKPRDQIINEDQLIKGFEAVLAVLEDAMNDAPKAGEFLGRMFAKVIMENVVSVSEIGRLIYEGGEEQGQLVEAGIAAEVVGCILEAIKLEKGESGLNEIRSSANLRLEDFKPSGSNKSFRIDKFI